MLQFAALANKSVGQTKKVLLIKDSIMRNLLRIADGDPIRKVDLYAGSLDLYKCKGNGYLYISKRTLYIHSVR